MATYFFYSTFFVLAILSLSQSSLAQSSLSQPSPKPEEYDTFVKSCLTDYKSCALGSTSSCSSCLDSCGSNEILVQTSPIVTLCTLLRDYCDFKQDSTSTCVEPNCVAYNKQCLENGPEDSSCGYCASSCSSCPELFSQCKPDLPVPSPDGSCPVTACTYYSKLCVISGSPSYCEYCDLACTGICDNESQSCASFVSQSA